jgi:alpha-tubulin suppressor-like RCC1 family protein
VSGGLTFTAVRAATNRTCAVTTTGVAYCWGSNAYGELGIGTRTGPQACPTVACSTSPIAVAGGLSFVAVSGGLAHACGVVIAGSVYCWGSNTYGQLGNGTMADTTMPVPVSQ